MKHILIFLPVIIFLQSCTISKRRYTAGYRVDLISAQPEQRDHSRQAVILASVHPLNSPALLRSLPDEKEIGKIQTESYGPGDDTLVFLNGARVCGKVTHVEPERIIYRTCSPGNETRTVQREIIHKIIFSNGSSEIMTNPNLQRQQPVTYQNPRYNPEEIESGKRKIFLGIFLPIAALLLLILGFAYYFVLVYAGVIAMVAAFIAGSLAQKAMRRNDQLRHPRLSTLITALMIILPIAFLIILVFGLDRFN